MTVATDASSMIARWLFATLHGSADLLALAPGGVWEDTLPELPAGQMQAFPAVVFLFQSGQDTRPTGREYVWADCIYVVKGIDKRTQYDRIADVNTQITLLLDNAAGTAGSGQVFACQRQATLRYRELVEGGPTFVHLGGQYRIQGR